VVNPAMVPTADYFRSLDEAVVGVVDVLERHYAEYRDQDLPELRGVVYGDPFEVYPNTTIAVIPQEGEIDADIACGVLRDEITVVVRYYCKRVEGPGKSNVYRELVRVRDALVLLFSDYTTLSTADGAPRVSKSLPKRWTIGALVDQYRTGEELLVRVCEVELAIELFAWKH